MLAKYMKSLNNKQSKKLKEIIKEIYPDKISGEELEKDRLSYDNTNILPYNLINSQAFLDTTFPNPCWFNSILYVLFNLKEFVDIFSMPSIYNNQSELADQIYYMMKQYQHEGNKKISTYYLYLNLKTYHDHHNYDGAFQSAPEFFQFLISDLINELDKVNSQWLENMFSFFFIGVEYCCNCRKEYHSYPYQDVILRIGVPDYEHAGKKSIITLYDCIYKTFYYPEGSVRKFEEPCHYCGGRRIYSMMSFANDHMPSVIVITLERGFIYDNRKQKVVTVNYPYLLDYNKVNNKCRSKYYMLKAVVIHEEVHYYSYVRAYNDQQWYMMDGDEIRKLTPTEFNRKVMKNPKASMLFYEQIDQNLMNYSTQPHRIIVYPDFNTDEELFKEYMDKQKGKEKDYHYIE